jgi:hypothetical protein
MPFVAIGLGLYLVNCAVGAAAQFTRLTFGVWHHILYGVVFAAAIAAALFAFHPALLVTLAALTLFPKARPRTLVHPALAVVGLLGYVVTLVLSPG